MKVDLKKSNETQERKDFSNIKTEIEEKDPSNEKKKKERKKINWKEEFAKLKDPKEFKKFLISVFIEIIIIVILFISCDNILSKDISEQSEQQSSQTISDGSMQNKIATEQQYFENIGPFLQQIITERNNMMEILKNADSMEKWKEAIRNSKLKSNR